MLWSKCSRFGINRRFSPATINVFIIHNTKKKIETQNTKQKQNKPANNCNWKKKVLERKKESAEKTCWLTDWVKTTTTCESTHTNDSFRAVRGGQTRFHSKRNLLLKYTCHRTNIIRFHVLRNISQAINPNLYWIRLRLNTWFSRQIENKNEEKN